MYRQMDIQLNPQVASKLFFGDRLTGMRVRKLLSRLQTEYDLGLQPWFFGYGNDGKPDQRAPLRMSMAGAMGDTVRLVAFGPMACKLLAQKAAAIQVAFIREGGSVVPVNIRSGEHGIERVQGVRRYFVPRMVLGKTAPDSFWWRCAKQVENQGAKWMEIAGEQLGHTIAEGIVTQCFDLLAAGDHIEGDHAEVVAQNWQRLKSIEDLGERKKERRVVLDVIKAAMDLRVTSVTGHSAYMATGPQGLRVLLKNIEFTVSAQLTGAWMVGRNKIEGMGAIRVASARIPICAHEESPRELESA